MIRCLVIYLVTIVLIEKYDCTTTTKQMTPEAHRFEQDREDSDSKSNDNSKIPIIHRQNVPRTKSYVNGGRRNSSTFHTPFPLASVDPETINKTAQLIKLVNKISVEDVFKIQDDEMTKKRVIQEAPVTFEDNPEPVVFLLEPRDSKGDFISNPEVIEEYRRSRKKKKKKKKKNKSTSSEESADSDGLEAYRRKNFVKGKHVKKKDDDKEGDDKGDRNEEMNHAENEGVNYEEKSDDYILSKKGSSSKRDVWDYEHEDWVVTKKLNWDDVHSSNSNETSEEKKHIIDKTEHDQIEREHEQFYERRDRFKDEINGQIVRKKETAWGHKDFSANDDTIPKVKPGSYSERKGNWVMKGKIDYFDNQRDYEERTSKKYYTEEKNGIDAWLRPNNTNKNWKTDPWNRPQKDYDNDYGNKHNTKPGSYWEENTSKWMKPDWHRPDKPSRPGYVIPDEDYKNKYITTEMNYIDSWIKEKDKKKPDKHHYDNDYHAPRKPNGNDKWENSNENNFHHKPFDIKLPRSGREKYRDQEELDELERKRIANPGRIRPIEHLEPQRSVSDGYPQFDPRLEDEEREQENRPRYNKKSHLRHAETQKKDWGVPTKMDWISGSREERHSNKNKDWSREMRNKDEGRGNEQPENRRPQWQKDERKPPEQKKTNKKQVEDFWNRHAHNDWDRVGVVDVYKKKTTQRERIKITIRTTDSKDIFDRHGNNDWDKVGTGRGGGGGGRDREEWGEREGRGGGGEREGWGGREDGGGREDRGERGSDDGRGGRDARGDRGERVKKVKEPQPDYQDKVSFESKPQSHRSQDSALPVYFGYVHTPLAFKEKKTIFDE